ncbi:MAG: hypothetical protein INR63_30915 [Actinomycetospora chiangmaiensis]|nr:hypothetical protein [Actinomycetospora chiangmaiensis]
MGKPRRPRGGRPAWEPKPPLDADVPSEAGAETPATGISAIETAKAVTAKYETSKDETAEAETTEDETATDPATDQGLAVEAAVVPEAGTAEPVAQATTETSDPQGDPQPEPSSAAAPDEAPIPEAEPVVQPGSAPTDAVAPDLSPVLAESPAVAAAPASQRIVFAPERWDVVEISSTIARYMRGEGEAALAHLRALSDARTPADLIRLQVGEAQRAADASLSCWVTVVSKASRVMAFR